MTQALKTQTKSAAKAKTAAKAKPAAKAKTTGSEAGLIAFIVEGIAKRVEEGSSFYAKALTHHAKNKTVFPRGRNDKRRATLKKEDAEMVFSLHDKKVLAPGNATGQAMFDVYMMAKR